MSFTTRQAKIELDQLERKLKDYEALRLRKDQLEDFLSLAEKLSAKPTVTKPQASPTPEPVRMTRHLSTADAASQVLERSGKLHLNSLHQQMRTLGWTGSGNPLNEKKAIYVAMLRAPNRFIKVGRNVWATLREPETKAAS
jgi:hypothetical protein